MFIQTADFSVKFLYQSLTKPSYHSIYYSQGFISLVL